MSDKQNAEMEQGIGIGAVVAIGALLLWLLGRRGKTDDGPQATASIGDLTLHQLTSKLPGDTLTWSVSVTNTSSISRSYGLVFLVTAIGISIKMAEKTLGAGSSTSWGSSFLISAAVPPPAGTYDVEIRVTFGGSTIRSRVFPGALRIDSPATPAAASIGSLTLRQPANYGRSRI